MTSLCTVTPESSAAFLDRASERCKASGAQLTPIRRDVLGLLYESENGLKAYDLLAKIKELRSNATPPTVYRALDFLIEQGLVHKIERINQFVVCRHESHCLPNLFLVCPRCGKVSDFHDHDLMKSLLAGLVSAGHRLVSPEVEIGAICPECSNSENPVGH
jgi:Fur family zinc uptake transcriptional regulator